MRKEDAIDALCFVLYALQMMIMMMLLLLLLMLIMMMDDLCRFGSVPW